ncbi:IS630 family transposase [Streptomyces sp. NPDC090021]|uniref:IS630 family transposase n=1 Tax=Streptomyces sp. NPDC090021 TaxID=3365919 RepID=UPI00381C241C
MELSVEQAAELRELVNSRDVPADIAARGRIVLWSGEGRRRKDIAGLLGVSLPTVDRWRTRYAEQGLAGLEGERPGGAREQVPARVRSRVIAHDTAGRHGAFALVHPGVGEVPEADREHHRVLALRRARLAGRTPEAAPVRHLQAFQGPRVRGEGGRCDRPVSVPSGRCGGPLDRREGADPGTGPDPARAARRLRGEREAHCRLRPARHGTSNVFAALNVSTGEVLGGCKPTRNGKDFLAFLKKAVKPHAGKDIHVVLDNLSTHTTPEVREWLVKNPHVHFHFTLVGSSWLNQIEIWFGILTRQSIRRSTFSSVNVLIKQIRDYINSWNENAKPFTWTAAAGEVLAKVRLVATNVKKLVNSNSN